MSALDPNSLRQQHSPLRSTPTAADADDFDPTAESDFDIDFSSSDDEAGVFFGTPKAVERKIVAALSRSIPATPIARDRTPTSAPRRSSLANRVNKRDSREFLRRKTLLLGTPGPSGEKVWEGGFHERPDATTEVEDAALEPLETAASPVAGPSTPMAQTREEMAVDLTDLRLDTFPSSEGDDGAEPVGEEFYVDDEEEDKENSAIPEGWMGDEEDEDEYIPAQAESIPLTIGFRADQFEHDMSPQLNMGNLSILDLDDPEEAPMELGNDTVGGAPAGSITLGSSTSSNATAASYDSIASASRHCELRRRSPSPTIEKQPLEAPTPPDNEFDDADTESLEDDAADEQEATPDVPRTTLPVLDVGDSSGSSSSGSPGTSTAEHLPELDGEQEADQLETRGTSLAEAAKSPGIPAPASPSESFGIFSSMFPTIPASAVTAPTFLDETFDLIAFTPLKPNGVSGEAAEATNTHVADASYESDMDSPMGRAPVMIPVFSVASPPKAAIPMRALEPMLLDDLAQFDAEPDTAVALPLLDSPRTGRGQSLSPLVNLAPTASKTPSKSPSKLPVLSPHKTSQPDSARTQRILARKAATKEHLENLFSSKLGSSSRPGPSSVLGKSTSTAAKPLVQTDGTKSAAGTKLALKATRTAQKPTEMGPKSALKASTTAPPKSILKSTSRTSATAKPRPVTQFAQQQPARPAASKPSALPRPTSAAKPSHLPRPALKRPAATVATAASSARAMAPSTAASASKATTGRLFRMAPTITAAKPAGEPANPLKRPYASTQPTISRPTPAGPSGTSSNSSGTQGRPTLGMPSRLVRDPVSGTTFFASSTSGSGSGEALFQPVVSPTKSNSPARPVLGKPYRPTGMTPLASRTMPTPQRGFPSASKSFKLGTASRPGATPLRGSRMMTAVSEERPPAPSPIRAPSPIPPKLFDQRMDVDKPPVPPQAEQATEPPVHDMPANAEARVFAPLSASLNGHASASPPTGVISAKSPPPEAGRDDEGKEGKQDSPTEEDKQESTPVAQGQSNGDSSPTNAAETTNTPHAQSAKSDANGTEDERPESRRSMRTRTPRVSTPAPSSPKAKKPPPPPSIVPGMTERELKNATTRNTARNQVYLCTIDRQIVRMPGDRPASPTSGIRTTAERDAEEQKAGRDARAKRRARSSLGSSEDESGDASASASTELDEEPAIEHATLGRIAPGDDVAYSTPVRRPAKRAKLDKSDSGSDTSDGAGRGRANGDEDEDDSRHVRWDEGLMIIRRGLGEVRHAHRRPVELKSCVTPRARYKLDENGNAIDRPTERLKRTTIRVKAVFYDGEEPVAFEYNKPASGGKKKGKK